MTRRAFTIVELLVVVAIIALLISLLLPVLGRARESARVVLCSNQLRQLGIASIAYSLDNDNYLFPVYYNLGPGGTPAARSWTDLLPQYIKKRELSGGQTYQDDFRSTYLCPNGILSGMTNQFPLSYAANRSVHSVLNQGAAAVGSTRALKNLATIKRASELVSLADVAQTSGAFTSAGWITYSDEPWLANTNEANNLWDKAFGGQPNSDNDNVYRVRYRHLKNQSAAVLYLDGHTDLARYRETLRYRNFSSSY
jgi:prepilin-type N-terminal cleavage/methylation domain-containing protein